MSRNIQAYQFNAICAMKSSAGSSKRRRTSLHEEEIFRISADFGTTEAASVSQAAGSDMAQPPCWTSSKGDFVYVK